MYVPSGEGVEVFGEGAFQNLDVINLIIPKSLKTIKKELIERKPRFLSIETYNCLLNNGIIIPFNKLLILNDFKHFFVKKIFIQIS